VNLLDGNYEAIFRQAPNPLVLLVADPPYYRIIDGNDAYLLLVHSPLEDIIGNSIFDALPSVSNPEFLPSFYELLRLSSDTDMVENGVQTQKILLVTDASQKGIKRYYIPFCVPVVVDKDTISHILFRLVEVTELESLKAPVMTLNEESDLVAETIAALKAELAESNVALREAKSNLVVLKRLLDNALKECESANRVKENFLAHVSHHLRTPLHAILGASQLLEKDPLTLSSVDYVQKIIESGRYLLRLINRLLDLAKLDAGKLKLVVVATNLVRILQDTVDLVTPLCIEKSLELIVSMDPQTPIHVACDELRVKEILCTLLENAVKFTESGAIKFTSTVQIRGHLLDLFITVEDTGTGIPYGHLSHIFERFNQTAIGGSGLGLTIARELVHLMHGNLTANSEVDMGTVFSLVIPMEVLAVEHSLTSEADSVTDLASRPILVVDDSRANRFVLCSLLKQLGFEDVREASDGLQAIETAKSCEDEDLIIFMDLYMPKMGGVQATQELRKIPRFAKTRIFANTACDTDEETDRACDQLFDCRLSKPMSRDTLKTCLQRYCNMHFT
jgi:signal transduction histidine kinase/CheY-like chemotaxis protein